jgi:hypothetical protein
MPAVTGAFPYNIDNLLGGAVRILRGPATGDTPVDVPATIDDVIDMVEPYAPKAGWVDVGATKESFTYTRGFETSGYEIQQVQAPVIEEITSITRTIELSVAEFRPDTLQMMENAPSIEAIAAATGASAQDKIAFGSFSDPNQYRFAFISRRSKSSGVVLEGAAGKERGRFFMGVLYVAQISADDVSMEQAKGALTASGITFTSFPLGGEPEGEEYGAWFDEHAGTITLV